MATQTAAAGWIDREGDKTISVQSEDSDGLARAFARASAEASSTRPYVIRVQAGDIVPSAVLTAPNYTTLVGAGMTSTKIVRSTTLANSVSVGSSNRDPLINAESTTNFRIVDLTLEHGGTNTTGFNPTALHLNNALGFQAINCRISGVGTTISRFDTAIVATPSESTTAIFTNCQLFCVDEPDANAYDVLLCQDTDCTLYNCYLEINGTGTGSQDIVRWSGGRLKMMGCDLVHRLTSTISSIGSPCACLNIISPASLATSNVYLEGCHLLFDISGGNINRSDQDYGCVDFRGSSASDIQLHAVGCHFEYLSGTLTAARSFDGFHIHQTTGDHTLDGIFLQGCSIRDLGGSGGTNRADVVIDVNTGLAMKQFRQRGSRISSWKYRTTGSPVPVVGQHLVTEHGINFQGASGTFATAATAAVTLPFPFAASGTDYLVQVEPSVNETFWVSAKTNTGFTLNSSNANSTATFRYVVVR